MSGAPGRRWWPRRPTTLRHQLALVAVAATAIWVTAATLVVNLAVGTRLRHQSDDLLRTRATAVAATVDVRPDGSLSIRDSTDDRALDAGVWIYQGHQPVERPDTSSVLQGRADALAGQQDVFVDTPDPEYRLYALAITDASDRQVGTVVVVTSLEPYRGTAQAALAGSIGLAVLMLAAVYLVCALIVRRALRPVTAMGAQAAQWSAEPVPGRFGVVAARPAELAELAGNLDRMLDRLGTMLRHERQLTAELSHELRTPLARISAETDWLAVRPRTPEQYRSSVRTIAASAVSMREICEDLLADAQGRWAPDSTSCDVHEVAAAMADGVLVRGQAVAGLGQHTLRRILAPLVDNARRYAVDAVVVVCGVRDEQPWVSVCDDGPGVPPEQVGQLFQAGWRGDPDDGHTGVGLGLALARRLAREAGGDICLEPADRGACFLVTLPPA